MTQYTPKTDREQPLTPSLSDAVEQIRNERPDPETLAAAADRVWQRIESAAGREIAGCDDFQDMIPAYLAGELSPERTLLLEDHSRECLPCRRALTAARTGEVAKATKPAAASPARTNRPGVGRWLALAAMLVAVLGLGGYLALGGAFAPGGGADVAVVESADGPLLHLGDDGEITPLAPGDSIDASDWVRTAHGGGAVMRLADGSAVELAGGTELSVRPRFASTTVQLAHGNIIVEAAKRDRGRLYVATDECRVAVTGTIFSVRHGVSGSRVSVIEGEVRVARSSAEDSVLHPGMQVTTRTSLTAVPVAEEVAWSRNNARYVELLRELTALARTLDAEVDRPGLRTHSALLGRAPAETIGFLAAPNLSEQLVQSWDVFRRQLATSPVLADWWQQNAPDAEAEIDRAVVALSDFGGYLGEEIAVAIAHAPNVETEPLRDGGPIVFAEIVRAGFGDYLDQEAARINTEAGHEALVVVEDPYAAPSIDGLLLWDAGDVFVATPRPELLALAADVASGVAPALDGPFHDRIDGAYADGVEWLFAADLERLRSMEGEESSAENAALPAELSWQSVGTFVIEHQSGEAAGARAQTAAELTFPEGRSGVASWIGEPGAIGALDFVSADAAAAVAVLLLEPAEIFDELLAMGGAEAMLELAEAEATVGIDFRADLAASLGREMAVALDGPLLPEPAWKVVLEVHDPGRLQSAVERLVQHAVTSGEAPALTVEASELAGRPAYRLADDSAAGEGFEVHYLYTDGYLVAAPSRALLARCLDQQAAGSSLTASAGFRELLPSGGDADASALFYQNLGPTISPLLGGLSELSVGQMDPDQARVLAEIAEDSEPTLGLLYAEPDRVRLAATSQSGVLGMGYRTLLGMGGLSELARATAEAE